MSHVITMHNSIHKFMRSHARYVKLAAYEKGGEQEKKSMKLAAYCINMEIFCKVEGEFIK